MSQKRQQAYRAGNRAEMVAALFLMAHGYRILERRYKTPVGEIDLIAANSTRLAFVEVKGRASIEQALGAVSARQQQRIRRAASHWLAKRRTPPLGEIGFDVIAIAPWKLPAHQKDAFSHTLS